MKIPLSVVTVTLNAGHDLAQTVASVRAQTFTAFEHIIKDGGSTDGSVEKAGEGGRARIVTRPDRGIYDAMNQALPECTGDYVLFLNAGDVFFDDAVLARVAESFGREGYPGLVYTDYATDLDRQRVVSPHRLSESYLFRTMLCHQACYVRRDYFERCGSFDASLKVDADFDFLLRLVLGAGARTFHLPIVGVVMKEGGFSSRAETFKLARQEAALVRRRHFTGLKRLLYGVPYAMTLPGLRIAILRNPSFAFVRPYYRRAVNVLNGLAYGRARDDSSQHSSVNRGGRACRRGGP